MAARRVKIELEGGRGEQPVSQDGTAGRAVRDVRVGATDAVLDGRLVPARVLREEGAVTAVEIEGVSIPVRTARERNRVFVWCGGRTYEFHKAEAASSRAVRHSAHAGGLLSPMPGRVRKLLVAEGDAVVRGQILLVLEAMKMEHAIRSPRDGRVGSLPFQEGDLVEAGVPVAEILE